MLLYVKHYGQMCNRLWALAPVVAYALHKRKHVLILFAKKAYLDGFPFLKHCKFLHFMFSHDNQKPRSIEWRLISFSEKNRLELNEDLRVADTIGLFTFVDGWKHGNDVSYIEEQKRELIKLFTPKDTIIYKVKRYFNNYTGITVGVHVRRGDYKSYLGGKYYFTDDDYLKIIEKIRVLLAIGDKKIRFMICSNEPFNFPKGNEDMFSIDETDGLTDLYALSCCDYIIGPPSSYSQWASFYGNVPLCIMLNKEFDIVIESFSRIIALNTFENGKHLNMDIVNNAYNIS